MKNYFLFAAVTIALAACNNDDNLPDEPVAVQISATIGQSSVSRAGETSWAEGDAIGITMSDRYLNLEYKTEAGDGVFTGTTTMYFKNKRDPETISAYYPYSGNAGQTPALMEASTDAENQTSEKQTEFDFLYASENVKGENHNVNLKFSHKMSKLTLNFSKGDGADDIEITSFTIEGMVLEGTFDPVSGVCAAKEDVEAQTLTILPTPVENGQMFPSLIVFPQAANSVILKIKDSKEQDYKCDLNFEDDAIESGNNYLFNITVNKTSLSVKGSISEWTEVVNEEPQNAYSDD